MAAKATTKRGLLPGYFESLEQKESKERYLEKLKSIEGQDPYEISRKEWMDDVDCWPDVQLTRSSRNVLSDWSTISLPLQWLQKVNWFGLQ